VGNAAGGGGNAGIAAQFLNARRIGRHQGP
jgi:hypothetical protein